MSRVLWRSTPTLFLAVSALTAQSETFLCNNYARLAVIQSRIAVAHRCSPGGADWSVDQHDQLASCKGSRVPPTQWLATRSQALENCTSVRFPWGALTLTGFVHLEDQPDLTLEQASYSDKYTPPRIEDSSACSVGSYENSQAVTWYGNKKGRQKRLEAFQLRFQGVEPAILDITYMCHVQDGRADYGRIPDNGDTEWLTGSTSQYCGTKGKSLRLEGFAVRLTGEYAKYFDVDYVCHIEDSGDQPPKRQTYREGGTDVDRCYCGSRNKGKRLEAFAIQVHPK